MNLKKGFDRTSVFIGTFVGIYFGYKFAVWFHADVCFYGFICGFVSGWAAVKFLSWVIQGCMENEVQMKGSAE
ncbi:MAG: hypothetical protein WB791_06140 [Waddliaceae bacterium]